jgi:integrase
VAGSGPVLAALLPVVVGNGKERHRHFTTTRKEGPHQLRHYYASVMLHDGVSITALAEYLGHHDPAFKVRVYGHLQRDSHERARSVIDARMNHRNVAGGRLRRVRPDERPPGA